jgi:hypothetical protein
MKRSVMAATIFWGLAIGGSGMVYAAGQPQLPGDMQSQQSARQQMDTKQMLDADKYKRGLPQSAANETDQTPAGKTGVEPRGTKVAPSTEPNQAQQPATAETGTPPRGTKVAPSTTPGQQSHQTQTR